MPPAETSLGTQELHGRRQQIQVGSGSWNPTGKVGSWCGNAGMWNKSQEVESLAVFYGLRNPGLLCACGAAAPDVRASRGARFAEEGALPRSLWSLPGVPSLSHLLRVVFGSGRPKYTHFP